jgi:hypothetical protein
MCGGYPAAGLEQVDKIPVTAVLLQSARLLPTLDPLDPYRINAVRDLTHVRVAGNLRERMRDNTEVGKDTGQNSNTRSPVVDGGYRSLPLQEIKCEIF